MKENTDLRVKRTLKSIRNAFYQLVMEKDYSDISITQLTDVAEINRKTFYLHYSSLEELVKEVEADIVADILKNVEQNAMNLDAAGCIRNFYSYLESCNDVQQKLLCDSHYSFFYEDVTDAVLKSPAFQKFFDMTDYPNLVRSYSIAITFIYRNWVMSNRPIPFDELTEQACKIIIHGYTGVIKK